MPEFYKQYRFADNNEPVQDWDQFLNIRIGAKLIKDTGDIYQKTADHVYEKVARNYLSNLDVEGKYALLKDTNIFTDPQYITVSPTEPYHIVNKEYVDACILSAQVDLSGFARIDRENIWEAVQVCNAEPKDRTHLTNKGYVDDRINEIEFDTTALAKLNSPNVFTAPQSVTVESTAPNHLVTKQYVDDTKTAIIDNISGFVRADLPNTFTATQTFQYTTIVPTPKTDTEAANKLYVDTKVTETQQQMGNFAALDLANVFEKDQTFRGNLISNVLPSQPYHLVNKEYADAILQGFQLPDNLASTVNEQTWTAKQTFAGGITVSDPVANDDAATKLYVDSKVQSAGVSDATTEIKGIVQLTKPVSNASTSGTQTPEEFAQNTTTVPTPKDVADYISRTSANMDDYAKLSAQNKFTELNDFTEVNISRANITDMSVYNSAQVEGTATFTQTVLSSIQEGSIITWAGPTQTMPEGSTAYTLELPNTTDAYDISIKTRYTSPDSPTLGFPENTVFLPEFDHRVSIDAGYDVEFGVIPLSAGKKDWCVGTAFFPLCVTYGDEDEEGNQELGINPGNIIFYLGIAEKINYLDVPKTQIYPATNLAAPFTNATDGIVTTKYVFSAPWTTLNINKIDITDESQAGYLTKYDFYKNLVQNSEDGVVKPSLNNFIRAVNNGWLQGCTEVTSSIHGLNITELDISRLTRIEFSDLVDPILNLTNANHLVLSNISNAVVNATNATVVVNGLSGELNAAKNSHVILKKSTAKVNLTYYSTCDDTEVQCEGTVDDTSNFYTTVKKKQWTLTFNSAGGEPQQDPIVVDDGTTWAQVKDRVKQPAKSGYNFLGWSVVE